jgi:hypothetical protein
VIDPQSQWHAANRLQVKALQVKALQVKALVLRVPGVPPRRVAVSRRLLDK